MTRAKRWCVSCKRWLAATEFSSRGHRSCAACIDYTHGGKTFDPRLRFDKAPPRAFDPITRPTYDGADLRAFEGRAGALDFLRWPSRIGNQLFHRKDQPDQPAQPEKPA